MARHSRKRNFSRLFGAVVSMSLLRSRKVALLLLVIVVWLGVFMVGEWVRRSEIESEIERIEEEIAAIESSGAELERTLKAFTQSETIEREARRRLNLARPGETVVVIPKGEGGVVSDEIDTRPQAPVVARSGTGPVVNVLAWWSFFFREEPSR